MVRDLMMETGVLDEDQTQTTPTPASDGAESNRVAIGQESARRSRNGKQGWNKG